MKMSFLVGGLLIAAPVLGQTSDRWVQVAAATNGSTFFVDSRTARRAGSHVVIWQREALSAPARDGTVERIAQYDYDCIERTSHLLSYVWHDRNGNPTASQSLSSYEREVRPIAPDSVAEGIIDAVCALGR